MIEIIEDFRKYLKERHFDRTLRKLEKICNGKRLVIYGTGLLFQAIVENYDLSNLNIVAVADRKFDTQKPDKFLGFKTCTPDEIKEINPDIVLVSVLKTVQIIENLRYNLLFNTNIRVLPLVERHLFEILKEIWC